MHLLLLPALLALVLCAQAAAAAAPLAERLPTAAGAWRPGETTTFDRTNLFSFIDGGAEVYFAYGFRRAWVVSYRALEQPEIGLELYDMTAPDDAYGVLSVDLTGEHVSVGSLARYGAGLLRFCKGPWFVRVLAERETPATRTAVLDLGKAVAAAIPEEAPPPALLRALPAQGLLPDSATFFHTQVTLNQLYYLAEGNLLGLGPEVQAATACYRARGGEARVVVVKYPASEQARVARDRFVTRYLEAKVTASDPVVRKTENKTFAGALAAPPYLLIALEAPGAASAKTLLTRLKAALLGGSDHARP
jgi:hypothetical protein